MSEIIRRAWDFYAQCVKWAFKGTLDLAFAWAWLIGVTVVAFVGWYSGLGVLMIPDNLQNFYVFSFVTIGVTFVLLFLIRLVLSPGVIYGNAKETLERLVEQTRPKLNVFLDPRNNGVQLVETETRTVPPAPGPATKWVQFIVQSATEAPLTGCEAKVVGIERLSADETVERELIQEAISCTWSQRPLGQNVSVRIPPHVPQAANLVTLADETGTPTLSPLFDHVKNSLLNEIQKPGRYRIKTVISADNTTAVKKTFVLDWGGSFSGVKLSMLD